MTRASWWMLIVGAFAGYLATMPPPTAWTWSQWMQTIAALAGIAVAKLSPGITAKEAPHGSREVL